MVLDVVPTLLMSTTLASTRTKWPLFILLADSGRIVLFGVHRWYAKCVTTSAILIFAVIHIWSATENKRM